MGKSGDGGEGKEGEGGYVDSSRVEVKCEGRGEMEM